jgi:hypothetical protein
MYGPTSKLGMVGGLILLGAHLSQRATSKRPSACILSLARYGRSPYFNAGLTALSHLFVQLTKCKLDGTPDEKSTTMLVERRKSFAQVRSRFFV